MSSALPAASSGVSTVVRNFITRIQPPQVRGVPVMRFLLRFFFEPFHHAAIRLPDARRRQPVPFRLSALMREVFIHTQNI